MMKPKTILLTTLMTAGTLGCAGDLSPAAPAGPPGAPATIERAAASAIDKAFAGLGGKDAVASLASFRIQATGERLMTLEGNTPFDDSQLISTFSSDVTDDVAGDRLRIAYERAIPLFGATTSYRVIVRGNLAATDGVESAFGAPGGALPSDRWASTVRQHRFLNPQLLLRDVALGKLTAAGAGVERRDGELRDRIEIAGDVRPISLFVDRGTGEITDLETFENDFVEGDVTLSAHYAGWQQAAGGVAFPADVVLALNGQVWHTEHRAR
jgi:hypothetical protein